MRIIVVDDEALVRRGFELMLSQSPDIEVVAAVAGGDALAAIARLAPDLVLLDVRMPDVGGLTILDALMATPAPPVVAMLTTFDSDVHVAAALERGASGYHVKDTDPADLADFVRTLARGALVLSPTAPRSVIARSVAPARALVDTPTPRERDVLILLADGLSNTEIGLRLHLGLGTVKDHVSAILTKLDASGRVQAALIAERAGLLSRDGAS